MHLKTLFALAALAAASWLAGAQSAGRRPLPAAAPALSLDEAIAKAVSNQPLILQAEASVAAAQAKEEQAKSAYLPNVSAAASYLILWPQEGEEINFKPTLPIDIQAPLTPLNMLDFHVGASELVYDFGKRELQVNIAASGVDAAGIGIDQIKTSIAFQTAQVFDSALFLRAEIKVIDEQLATLQQHLEDTQKREETGSSTHLDVLTTQVRLASVKSLRIDAEGQYAKQRIALKELMGLADAEDFDIQGDFSLAPSPGDAKAVLETAISQRPDIAQSLSAEKQAQLALSLAKLGHMPTISTEAQAGIKNGVLTFTNTDVDALLFNWDFGLMVSVPVFDGLLTERRSAEADARLAAARSGHGGAQANRRDPGAPGPPGPRVEPRADAELLAQLDQAQEALKHGEGPVRYRRGDQPRVPRLPDLAGAREAQQPERHLPRATEPASTEADPRDEAVGKGLAGRGRPL